jgi:hypothetical protein
LGQVIQTSTELGLAQSKVMNKLLPVVIDWGVVTGGLCLLPVPSFSISLPLHLFRLADNKYGTLIAIESAFRAVFLFNLVISTDPAQLKSLNHQVKYQKA